MEQLNIFEEPTGEELRDIGINKAVQHADEESENWSKEAYRYLTIFIKHHECEFMTENFREYCEKFKLPTPPSLRAYGSIMVKAANNGLIKKVGYGNVNNPKAHCTPASIWIKNN